MRKNNDTFKSEYISPKCVRLTVEAEGIFSTSAQWNDNIKDPSWNTDGDYGLE